MLIDFYLVLELCIGSQISDSRNFDHFVTKRIFQIRHVTYVQKYDSKDDTNVDTTGNTTVDFYVILELHSNFIHFAIIENCTLTSFLS